MTPLSSFRSTLVAITLLFAVTLPATAVVNDSDMSLTFDTTQNASFPVACGNSRYYFSPGTVCPPNLATAKPMVECVLNLCVLQSQKVTVDCGVGCPADNSPTNIRLGNKVYKWAHLASLKEACRNPNTAPAAPRTFSLFATPDHLVTCPNLPYNFSVGTKCPTTTSPKDKIVCELDPCSRSSDIISRPISEGCPLNRTPVSLTLNGVKYDFGGSPFCDAPTFASSDRSSRTMY